MKQIKFILSFIIFSIFFSSYNVYCQDQNPTFWKSLKQKWDNVTSWIAQKWQEISKPKEEKESIECPKAISYKTDKDNKEKAKELKKETSAKETKKK